MDKKKDDKLEPLEAIKRLLILSLIQNGIKSKDIATVLDVVPATITKMVSIKHKKKK